MREPHAARCQIVEAGSLYHSRVVRAECIMAVLICEEEKNIGSGVIHIDGSLQRIVDKTRRLVQEGGRDTR